MLPNIPIDPSDTPRLLLGKRIQKILIGPEDPQRTPPRTPRIHGSRRPPGKSARLPGLLGLLDGVQEASTSLALQVVVIARQVAALGCNRVRTVILT